MGETKKCRACLQVKNIKNFHKDSEKADNLKIRCKDCCKNKIPTVERIKSTHRFKDRVGETYLSNRGEKATIIFQHSQKCDIEFEDGTAVKNITLSNILKNRFKNPNKKEVNGVGFVSGKVGTTPLNKRCYTKWTGLLSRCYSKEFLLKRPSYIGCTVCEEWHNFQNFAKWFYENYNLETMQGWHLDKDILVKGNKIYSPKTCCFVPQEINSSFVVFKSLRKDLPIGVIKLNNTSFKAQFGRGKKYKSKICDTVEEAFKHYKQMKQVYIKEMADKWKSKIDLRVYQAMYNYRVEITD